MYQVRIDLEEAERIGRIRGDGKEAFASTRSLTENYHMVGAAGELAFGAVTNRAVDDTKRIGGDNGTDFHFVCNVDVKTTTYPFDRAVLLVEVGKVRANIYVLAALDGNVVTLCGWAWRYQVEQARVDTGYKFRHGIQNYYLYAGELNEMEELVQIFR